MKKRVLVYPCGTEIGLEIFRAVEHSIHFELVGGSSSYDHGRFVYSQHIDNLPFITDSSDAEEIIRFDEMIRDQNIDFIYPAMDGIIYKFSEFRHLLKPIVIAPDFNTASITRSKSKTYDLLKSAMNIPRCYHFDDMNLEFPLFIKPDVGQGSVNTKRVNNQEDLNRFCMDMDPSGMLLLEYLPGEEYTVDCFTNNDGKLIYAGGRTRKRVKGGISVNAIGEKNPELLRLAEIINSKLNQKGGWFFQVKKNIDGDFSLLEVASRIAGTSSYTRNLGINLPLLTLHLFNGNHIDQVLVNEYEIELDRALYNRFVSNIKYDKVFIDFDDTIIVNGNVNLQMIMFIYQCINEQIPIILITRHAGDLEENLRKFHLQGVFDQVIHIGSDDEKYLYIDTPQSIFIDDSYGERAKVKKHTGIHVFDTHMMECLIKK